MKINRYLWSVLLITWCLMTVGLLLSQQKVLQAQQVRVIEIKAQDQHFIPDKITVTAGEVIKLRVIAKKDEEVSKEGYVHSWTIKKLGLDFKVKEGVNEFTFVAPDKPGTYKFECAVDCGSKHDYMTGKMVVE